MTGALKKLKSLKGRSLDELRVRTAQRLSAARERSGLSSQARIPTDDAFFKLLAAEARATLRSATELHSDFRARKRTGFFASFGNRVETIEELRRRFGKEVQERVIEKAE